MQPEQYLPVASGVSEPLSCVKAILCHLARQERDGSWMAFIQTFVLQSEKMEKNFPTVWCPAWPKGCRSGAHP